MKIISVTDRKNCIRPLEEQVELICKAGVDMVVLREKDMPPEDYLALADSIRRICARYETEFCINGFTDIARDLGVGTAWVSFPSITESGRLDFPKVGVSVHSVGEVDVAENLGAGFIIFGNVFETSCKPGKPAAGLEELSRICCKSDVPVYAIGGMCPENASAASDAGAAGICMMSGLMAAPDPAAVIEAVRRV